MALAGCTTVQPVAATSNAVGSKVGEASGGFLFTVIPMGGADCSIKAAAQNAGITKISTVDQKVTLYLGFWANVTTIVTGE
ncbi:TRL-like family protein [Treponema brennaborense]|nr:TRL-like family protein [Treponema brennaborense]